MKKIILILIFSFLLGKSTVFSDPQFVHYDDKPSIGSCRDEMNDNKGNRLAIEVERVFSIRAFQKIVEDKTKGKMLDNICISPFSLYNVMGLLAVGASGAIRDSLERGVIGTTGEMESLSKQIGKEASFILSRNRGNLNEHPNQWCAIANSIWYPPFLTVKSDFEKGVAELTNVELLAQDPNGPGGMNMINEWTDIHTCGLIPKLLTGPLTEVNCFLANTIYFIGSWEREFSKERNLRKKFRSLNGRISNVEFLTGTRLTNYYENAEMQVLMMRLGNDYQIRFFLPKEGRNILREIKRLQGDIFKEVKSGEKLHSAYMEIPKFSYDSTVEVERVVRELTGIEKLECMEMFEKASNIFPIGTQVCKMILDENGIEAAAVTYFVSVMENTGVEPPVYPKATVKLNRPFFYTVEVPATGTILFMGAVTNL